MTLGVGGCWWTSGVGGHRWASVGFDGYQWVLVGVGGCQLVSLGVAGCCWVMVGVDGCGGARWVLVVRLESIGYVGYRFESMGVCSEGGCRLP